MIGENFVSLTGFIINPSFKQVGVNNSSLFTAQIAIPNGTDKNQYVKITAWGGTAEGLNDLPKNVFVKVHGYIEERSYDGSCKHCGGPDKKYWTSVVVSNFILVEE
jgi:hypothetical protein